MTILNVTQLSLAKRLRAARLMADLEQADIAERIGVARQTVSNWEQGRTEPSATYFVRWAEATGQPLEWLAEGVEVRPEGFEPPAYCSVADLLPTMGPCPVCDGSGQVYSHRLKRWQQCDRCGGDGWLTPFSRDELELAA